MYLYLYKSKNTYDTNLAVLSVQIQLSAVIPAMAARCLFLLLLSGMIQVTGMWRIVRKRTSIHA